MSKRSKRARKRPRRRPAQEARPTDIQVPSAATFFRFSLVDAQTTALMEGATSLLKPTLGARDRGKVKQIRGAATPEELLDLLPLASGPGEPAWNQRMRQFGAEALPLISERLRTLKTIRDRDVRDAAAEKLIGVLRYQGDAAVPVLLERFDDLSVYGQSLACVTLGLLGAEKGADRMWRFYQKAIRTPGDLHFVGALWGLIDLKDGRAGPALARLLKHGHVFYEIYGFLSLAAHAGAVAPLAREAYRRQDQRKDHAIMALASVAHRIGREALLAEFRKTAAPHNAPETLEAIADDLLAKPMEDVEAYFGLFYRGLRPDDLAGLFPGAR
jgi:hypothetical protein